LITTLIVAATSPLAAQRWSSTAYGVAEYGTDETTLLLAGISAGPGGLGVHPRFGVQAYYLTFNPNNRVNVVTVKPFVGLTNVYPGGSVSGSIGYAFTNKDSNFPAVPVSSSESGEGVVLSGGWDHWGPDAHALAYQALGSYNFGSSSLWTRGRITAPLSVRSGGGATRLGGEVAFLHGDTYRAWQPGAVLEFHDSKNRILGLGAGAKLIQGNDTEAYFKVEGVLPISR
jgi:hypothetical protein